MRAPRANLSAPGARGLTMARQMRIADPTYFTPTRLRRLTHWLSLSLQYLVAMFAYLSADHALLKRAAHAVAVVVFLHATRFVTPPPRRLRQRLKRGGLMRAAIGSRLRRMLRARDPAARVFAMLSVMRDLKKHISRLAKRLARGLTRLIGRRARKSKDRSPRVAAPFALAAPNSS